jgi:hypothetical protein
MLSWFKKKVEEPELSPVDGRREHFFNVFDSKYRFMLDMGIVSDDSYNSVKTFYAQSQENLYQNILSFVEENDS